MPLEYMNFPRNSQKMTTQIKRWEHVVEFDSALEILSSMMALRDDGKYVYASEYSRLEAENSELKRETERYRIAIAEVMRQVDGNIRETVRDCVNGHNDVQDIYDYCDQIEEVINTAQGLK